MELGLVERVTVWVSNEEILSIPFDEVTTFSQLVEMASIPSGYVPIIFEKDFMGRICKTIALNTSDKVINHRSMTAISEMFNEERQDRESLKGEKERVRAPQCDLWLVDRERKIRIFFNPYIRMVLGLSMWYLDLYIHSEANIAAVAQLVKDCLKIEEDDDRFALFGNYPSHVELLREDDIVYEFERESENPANSFWQFMIKAEKEIQGQLGVERQSHLWVKSSGFSFGSQQKWCTLQGTTLTYYKSKGDLKSRRIIENVDQCKIAYRGGNRRKTNWIFDIIRPDGKIFRFKSPSKRRIEKWVSCLMGCHKSCEINEPITIEQIMQYKTAQQAPPIFAPMEIKPTTDHRNKDKEYSVEKIVRKIEIGADVLGKRRSLRRKECYTWIETIRFFMLEILKIQNPQYVENVVHEIEVLVDHLKKFVDVAENSSEFMLPPEYAAEIIQNILESVMCLNTFYRDVVMMGNIEEDEALNIQEYHEQMDILYKLRKALHKPIMDIKLTRIPIKKANSKWHILDWWSKMITTRKTSIPRKEALEMSLPIPAPDETLLTTHPATPSTVRRKDLYYTVGEEGSPISEMRNLCLDDCYIDGSRTARQSPYPRTGKNRPSLSPLKNVQRALSLRRHPVSPGPIPTIEERRKSMV